MELRDKEITEQINNETTNEASGADENSAPDTDKKRSFNPIKRMKEGGMFTLPFKVLCYAFVSALCVYVISRFIPAFAEFWTRYPAQALRFVLAKLTGWFPFSLAECLIVSMPILAIGYITASSVSTSRDESDRNFFRWLKPLVSVILVIATIFLAGFGPAYGRYKLSDNLGLAQVPVSAEELYSTSVKVCKDIKGVMSDVKFDANGSSVMPYGYAEMIDKVNEAYVKYAGSVDYISHFKSRPKAIALSEPMTYTHISGVYTFMTGESNINTNYPDFLMPFTVAHEMAHQRGIAREDEANFVAFLVCINSDDAYIRYCGYANMLNYLNSALSRADSTLYKQFFYENMPKKLTNEFVAYSDFFDKYRRSVASAVTDTINDAFLQSQGQQAGTKSYGLVVDLAVAYYK